MTPNPAYFDASLWALHAYGSVVGSRPWRKGKAVDAHLLMDCADLACNDDAAMLAKIEGAAARLALVLHCVRVVTDEAETVDARLDATSMRAGIALAEWFADEAERVYDEVHRSPAERTRDEVLDLVARFQGRMRIRDLQRHGPRPLRRHVATAKAALQNLVDDGEGHWVEVAPTTRGGRKTWEFVLATATQLASSSSNGGVSSPSPE